MVRFWSRLREQDDVAKFEALARAFDVGDALGPLAAVCIDGLETNICRRRWRRWRRRFHSCHCRLCRSGWLRLRALRLRPWLRRPCGAAVAAPVVTAMAGPAAQAFAEAPGQPPA